MNRKASHISLVVVLLMGLVNCVTNHIPDLNNVPPVETIIATNGTPQSHAVGGAFGAPLTAMVTTNGLPSGGTVVTFRAPSTGASGTFADTSSNTSTATTNASGLAVSAAFTANATPGVYSVLASAPGASVLAPFTLANTTAAPAGIVATSGTPQSASINAAFAAPFVGTVIDSSQNPVANAVVIFTAPTTGASGVFADTNLNTTTATSDGSGVVTSAAFTANGTIGPYNVIAAVAGVSVPATFNLTNTTGSATSITSTSGSLQSATASTAFTSPLVVTVTDVAHNPVNGALVTFAAPSSGASATFADTGTATTTATTNSSGVATSTILTANGTSGTYTVTATVAGVATTFSLTNSPGAGPPAAISAVSGNPQSAAINSPFSNPFAAMVVDSASKPVSGAVVTFTAPSSGASGVFADTSTGITTATTNSLGVATSTGFTANGTTGSYVVLATVTGVTNPANFTLTNTPQAGLPSAITATSGTPQSAALNAAFALPLVATVVDAAQVPVSGVLVTFTAPSSGASGVFTDTGTTTSTATTSSSGIATSTTFTANGTTGSYNVTATVSGVSTPANFSLSNASIPKTYVFYLDGEETSGLSLYGLVGSVQIDSTGNVVGGEQDYNDGLGLLSPQPGGDQITGGALVVDPTSGQGTLTLNTNNTLLGVGGIETLGVQFVNLNHALIIQFDGSATSSGAMDLQSTATSTDGGYAFAITAVDGFYSATGYGGVFSMSAGTVQNGIVDTNDGGTSTVLTGTAWSGTISTPDSLGRGTITGFNNPVLGAAVALNYYVVGPEAIRIIDVDAGDSGVGSAFGQGTNATGATNAALGNSVFALTGSPFLINWGAVGMFVPSNTSSSTADFAGVGDDNEVIYGIILPASSISGTYSVASNGYGSLSVNGGSLGSVTNLGIYLTDPNLNLEDPNNSTSGLGGGLAADMDPALPGGIGILFPQTDTSAASFTGNYAFGGQDPSFGCCEFDFFGQGSMTSGALAGTGLASDPFAILGGSLTNTGVTYAGTPLADTGNPGRFTMFATDTVPNPFNITVGTITTSFSVAIYQASGGQLFWLDEDATGVFGGPLQQQGSLTGLPPSRKGRKKGAQ